MDPEDENNGNLLDDVRKFRPRMQNRKPSSYKLRHAFSNEEIDRKCDDEIIPEADEIEESQEIKPKRLLMPKNALFLNELSNKLKVRSPEANVQSDVNEDKPTETQVDGGVKSDVQLKSTENVEIRRPMPAMVSELKTRVKRRALTMDLGNLENIVHSQKVYLEPKITERVKDTPKLLEIRYSESKIDQMAPQQRACSEKPPGPHSVIIKIIAETATISKSNAERIVNVIGENVTRKTKTLDRPSTAKTAIVEDNLTRTITVPAATKIQQERVVATDASQSIAADKSTKPVDNQSRDSKSATSPSNTVATSANANDSCNASAETSKHRFGKSIGTPGNAIGARSWALDKSESANIVIENRPVKIADTTPGAVDSTGGIKSPLPISSDNKADQFQFPAKRWMSAKTDTTKDNKNVESDIINVFKSGDSKTIESTSELVIQPAKNTTSQPVRPNSLSSQATKWREASIKAASKSSGVANNSDDNKVTAPGLIGINPTLPISTYNKTDKSPVKPKNWTLLQNDIPKQTLNSLSKTTGSKVFETKSNSPTKSNQVKSAVVGSIETNASSKQTVSSVSITDDRKVLETKSESKIPVTKEITSQSVRPNTFTQHWREPKTNDDPFKTKQVETVIGITPINITSKQTVSSVSKTDTPKVLETKSECEVPATKETTSQPVRPNTFRQRWQEPLTTDAPLKSKQVESVVGTTPISASPTKESNFFLNLKKNEYPAGFGGIRVLTASTKSNLGVSDSKDNQDLKVSQTSTKDLSLSPTNQEIRNDPKKVLHKISPTKDEDLQQNRKFSFGSKAKWGSTKNIGSPDSTNNKSESVVQSSPEEKPKTSNVDFMSVVNKVFNIPDSSRVDSDKPVARDEIRLENKIKNENKLDTKFSSNILSVDEKEMTPKSLNQKEITPRSIGSIRTRTTSTSETKVINKSPSEEAKPVSRSASIVSNTGLDKTDFSHQLRSNSVHSRFGDNRRRTINSLDLKELIVETVPAVQANKDKELAKVNETVAANTDSTGKTLNQGKVPLRSTRITDNRRQTIDFLEQKEIIDRLETEKKRTATNINTSSSQIGFRKNSYLQTDGNVEKSNIGASRDQNDLKSATTPQTNSTIPSNSEQKPEKEYYLNVTIGKSNPGFLRGQKVDTKQFETSNNISTSSTKAVGTTKTSPEQMSSKIAAGFHKPVSSSISVDSTNLNASRFGQRSFGSSHKFGSDSALNKPDSTVTSMDLSTSPNRGTLGSAAFKAVPKIEEQPSQAPTRHATSGSVNPANSISDIFAKLAAEKSKPRS